MRRPRAPGLRWRPTYSSSAATGKPDVDGAHGVYAGSMRLIVAMTLTPFAENANPLLALEGADTPPSRGPRGIATLSGRFRGVTRGAAASGCFRACSA